MMRLLIAILGLMMLAHGAVARPAGPSRDQPYVLMRTLQHVQARIADGSAVAVQLKAKLLDHMAIQFSNYPLSVWSTPRNGEAAVSYVLSGGRPDAVRHLAADGVLGELFHALFIGALAYADGRAGAAEVVFSKVDEFSLPAALGGHVAMIKAVLVSGRDAKAALALLDRARLLMPATLIEETALRRGMILAAGTGDRDKFMSQSDSYLRRFARSVYQPDFREKFALEAVKLDIGAVPGLLDDVGRVTQALEPDQRVIFYLTLARTGLERGANVIARDAADRARDLAPVKSNEWVRANTYDAAANVVTERRDIAVQQLRETDLSQLGRRDRELVTAALKVADEVERIPNTALLPPGDAAQQPLPEILSQAEQLLRDVDALVEGTLQ